MTESSFSFFKRIERCHIPDCPNTRDFCGLFSSTGSGWQKIVQAQYPKTKFAKSLLLCGLHFKSSRFNEFAEAPRLIRTSDPVYINREEVLKAGTMALNGPRRILKVKKFHKTAFEDLKWFREESASFDFLDNSSSSKNNCTIQMIHKCSYCLEFFPSETGLMEHVRHCRIVYIKEELPDDYDLESADQTGLCDIKPEVEVKSECEETPGVSTSWEEESIVRVPKISEASGGFEPNKSPTFSRRTPFSCEFCEERFTYHIQKTDHMRIHIGEMGHLCDLCGRKFASPILLANHMIFHAEKTSGPSTYLCDLCEKKCTSSTLLAIHRRSHTGERPYSCGICGESFAHLSGKGQHMRKKHMNNHAEEKPYACDFCEKKFILASVRDAHMKVHPGYMPYACDFCEKKFVLSRFKNSHMRVHTSKKPYACNFCETKFILASVRDEHMKVHNGQTPYASDFCEKTFSSDDNRSDSVTHIKLDTGEKQVVQHNNKPEPMLVHTGKELFSCLFCKKIFAERRHMVAHMKLHAREKP